MEQGIFQNAVVKGGVVGNHELIGREEFLDVLPHLRKGRGVFYIALVDPVNLGVTPKKGRLRVN